MSDAPHSANQHHAPRHEHERKDVNIRPIVTFIVVLFIVAVVIHIGLWLLYGYFTTDQAKAEPPAPPLAETRRVPPPPRLQVAPEQDLDQYRTGEETKLNSYGWVDKGAGVVHIPIDRAMDLLVEKGVSSRPAAPAQAGQETESPMGQGLPEGSSSGRTMEKREWR
jgi:hypothetical protein